ncbi:uncharacterized protein C8R40DRAFT_383702 [Lentinula edodes]|nr:uncharacterized protein C8R40DRAFT_383702 [Lentinula edodes]KAH7873370.1 hypothetical protein C8R40DRAFT_383702 [Lentinula edodes]
MMAYRENRPDRRSISSLLNPVVLNSDVPPPNFSSNDNMPRSHHYAQLVKTSRTEFDRHSSNPDLVGSGLHLPPRSKMEWPRNLHNNHRRTSNRNDIPNITSKMPRTRHSPVGSASGQFYGEGYPNGVTSSTAYVSDISGLPFRNEQLTGLVQSNPMPQAPVHSSSNLEKNPVAQNPGGTFHTFSVALRKEYSSIRTSPLVIRPRTAEISPQPRICSACGITHTVLWRKSKVHPGNYLCNRCGLWERNNRVERTTLAEGHTSMVKEFIVQSPYSSEGDILE